MLRVFARLSPDSNCLVFVGDGDLRKPLIDYVKSKRIANVHFPGFQNRSQITKYYAMADLLVLPSIRETWGMVVNEAMCFSLPVILSSAVGAVEDMMIEGVNGFSFTSGDDDGLFSALDKFINLELEDQKLMGAQSFAIIENWVSRDLGLAISDALDQAFSP